jgi:hypothetical protein
MIWEFWIVPLLAKPLMTLRSPPLNNDFWLQIKNLAPDVSCAESPILVVGNILGLRSTDPFLEAERFEATLERLLRAAFPDAKEQPVRLPWPARAAVGIKIITVPMGSIRAPASPAIRANFRWKDGLVLAVSLLSCAANREGAWT